MLALLGLLTKVGLKLSRKTFFYISRIFKDVKNLEGKYLYKFVFSLRIPPEGEGGEADRRAPVSVPSILEKAASEVGTVGCICDCTFSCEDHHFNFYPLLCLAWVEKNISLNIFVANQILMINQVGIEINLSRCSPQWSWGTTYLGQSHKLCLDDPQGINHPG